MPRPLVTNVVADTQAISADGVQNFELSVNPLSVLLLGVRPLNDTGTLANYNRYLNVMKSLERVSLIYRGQSIISMRGEDIVAYNWLRWGILPPPANADNVDNERRCDILPLILGSMPYDPRSCFPETRRGELTLQVQFDIADTGYDGLRFSVDSIELLDAKPVEFERKIEISRTNSATGNNDMDLIPGNLVRNVLLFGTTGFGGATPAPSWGNIRVLLDNQEAFYSGVDWEVLQAMPYLFGRQASMAEHKHTVNAAGAGVEETTSVFDVDDDFLNYALLDFDVTRDDMFSLQTKGKNKFVIRHNAETADAIRAVQTEVVKVSELA